ncbi:MAG: diaminopimelate epimerase [Planctomycetota bacterium]
MRFTKMHGAANDYVVVDCFERAAPDDLEPLIRAVCDRRRGVGADGFVLVLPDDRSDAEMRMYNPDGSFSAMCGNAVRCVAKLLRDTGRLSHAEFTIRSAERLVPVRMIDESGTVSRVEANLGVPELEPACLPTTLAKTREARLALGDAEVTVTCISMGNPHCVLFTDQFASHDVDRSDVAGVGPLVENHAVFPKRTNVEFVEVIDRDRVRQRTWERGAGETLACGSGACATSVAAAMTGRTGRRVSVELRGGVLDIEWRDADDNVLMTGDAVTVFDGDWPL